MGPFLGDYYQCLGIHGILYSDIAGRFAINPKDLYEAASIDGANEWNAFSKITMPLLMPQMMVVMVLSLIRAVQIFDVVFAFTGGDQVLRHFILSSISTAKVFPAPANNLDWLRQLLC